MEDRNFGGSHCNHCDHCNTNSWVAGRLDIWQTASAALRAQDWDEPVLPHDVYLLAQFLAGDTQNS